MQYAQFLYAPPASIHQKQHQFFLSPVFRVVKLMNPETTPDERGDATLRLASRCGGVKTCLTFSKLSCCCCIRTTAFGVAHSKSLQLIFALSFSRVLRVLPPKAEKFYASKCEDFDLKVTTRFLLSFLNFRVQMWQPREDSTS